MMQWVLTQLDIKIKNGYLYNPIDIKYIPQKSNQQPDNPTDLALLHQPFLLQVARLESGKNHQQLINIFAQLKQQGLPHKPYIIGDGELYHTLNHQIQTLRLATECLLLGSYTNPYPLMKHADLFLAQRFANRTHRKYDLWYACGCNEMSHWRCRNFGRWAIWHFD